MGSPIKNALNEMLSKLDKINKAIKVFLEK